MVIMNKKCKCRWISPEAADACIACGRSIKSSGYTLTDLPFSSPRTDEEQKKIREEGVQDLVKLIVVDDRSKVKFTCDECTSNRTCAYAFDGYNTDGDCLAEK